MQRERMGSLAQLGLAILLIGLAIKVALWLGMMLSPFANLAMGVGIVVLILGLVLPNRR